MIELRAVLFLLLPVIMGVLVGGSMLILDWVSNTPDWIEYGVMAFIITFDIIAILLVVALIFGGVGEK